MDVETAAPPPQQVPQPQVPQGGVRLTLDTLDPRTMYPSADNVARVRALVERVGAQLEEDRARSKLSPDDVHLKELRNQSLSYLALLNDWLLQVQPRGANGGPALSAQQQQLLQQQQHLPQQQQQQQARQNQFQGVVLDPAREDDAVAVSVANFPPEPRKCLVDLTRALHYVQIKKIRDTIYGSVRLYQIGRMDRSAVRFADPAEQVAIKIFDKEKVRRRKSRDGHSVQEDPMRELAIQQRLSNPGHRFVMPLLACLETAEKFFAVYPFVSGGELFEFVSAQAPLPEPTARSLMRGMLDAVHYCHMAGVCHRDISLENFLLGGENGAFPLLIDFGLSVVMEPAGTGGGNQWKPIPHTGAVGKQFYMAPEVYAGAAFPPYDGCKVDVWSLGVSLAIMVTGVPLWEVPSTIDDRFRASIIKKELPRVLALWGFNLSPALINLLQKMLELDPKKRSSIPEIAQHEWFRG